MGSDIELIYAEMGALDALKYMLFCMHDMRIVDLKVKPPSVAGETPEGAHGSGHGRTDALRAPSWRTRRALSGTVSIFEKLEGVGEQCSLKGRFGEDQPWLPADLRGWSP